MKENSSEHYQIESSQIDECCIKACLSVRPFSAHAANADQYFRAQGLGMMKCICLVILDRNPAAADLQP